MDLSQTTLLDKLYDDIKKNKSQALNLLKIFLKGQLNTKDILGEDNENLDMGTKCYNLSNDLIDSNVCINVLEKCLIGDESCVDEFDEMTKKWSNGIDLENANVGLIQNLLYKMNIQSDCEPKVAIKNWVNTLHEPTRTNVKSNGILLNLILQFIIKVKLATSECYKKQENLTLQDGIMYRPTRFNKNLQKHRELQMGGGNNITIDPTFPQLFDSIKYSINMTGGEISYYDQFVNSYNIFNDYLKSKNKKIHSDDDFTIKQIIASYKQSKDKLDKIGKYIGIVFKMEGDSNKFKDILNMLKTEKDIDLDLIKEMSVKYNDIKEINKTKTLDLLSILNTLYSKINKL